MTRTRQAMILWTIAALVGVSTCLMIIKEHLKSDMTPEGVAREIATMSEPTISDIDHRNDIFTIVKVQPIPHGDLRRVIVKREKDGQLLSALTPVTFSKGNKIKLVEVRYPSNVLGHYTYFNLVKLD